MRARLEALSLAAGLAVTVYAVFMRDEPLARHMIQHGLFACVAAPLIVLGGPVTLLLRRLSLRRRRDLMAVLQSRPLELLTHPLTAFALFVTCQWLCHVGPFFRLVERSETAHGAEHIAILTTAILFWLPLVGHAPLRRRLRGVERCLYLSFAMPAVDLIGVWYIATGRKAAGAAMLASMLPLGFAFIGVGWQWVASEHRRQLRREALGV